MVCTVQGDAIFNALGRLALGVVCHCTGCCSCDAATRFDAAAVLKISELKKASRSALRADRKAWFDVACAQAAVDERNRASRELHLAVKALSKGSEHRGWRLKDGTGAVVTDRGIVEQMWLDFWTQHFDAKMGDAGDFTDRSVLTTPGCPAVSSDIALPATFHFTAAEVTKTIRSMPRWRATADSAPAAAVMQAAGQLGPPLAEVFNSCVRSSTVPRAYSGARLVPVWKRKGPAHDCASYRPVALMLLEAKVFA
eukprot:565442-Amphidinium_carterae.2